jgi:2-polyprenyl-6-methoxyphenol hydroxylase-like FAD-dependent oxidoreductase
MASDARLQLPVLVIGAGPAGLILAAELIRHGTSCRIVDKAEGPTPLSKATTVQARSLEMLEDMGIVDEAVRAGTRSHGVNIYHGTDRLLHVSYDELESPYPFLLNIPQSGMERVLGGLVARLGLQIEWRTELLGFTQDDEGVTATLRHPDGQTETVRAAWLVGCDGAHSIVRHVLDIPFAGHTYSQWFGLADARLHWGLGHDELHGFVHPRGLFFAIPEPGEERFRVVMEAEEPPVGSDLTLADFQAALDERGPGNATLSDPGWISPFKVNARRAERYRVGRAFIAGDAAHIHSPTGGLGLNTGMQDAYNLAWKLALVIRGVAVPALLDSYQAERLPVADAVLRLAGRLTSMLTLTNPVSRELRDHLMPVLSGLGAVQHQIAVEDAQLSITYSHSPIVSEYHHEGFGHVRFAGGPRAGDRAPDAGPLNAVDGPAVRLYDLLRGIHHTLVLFGGPAPEANTWQQLVSIARAASGQPEDIMRVYIVVDGATVPDELAGNRGVLLDTGGAAHHRYQADVPTLYLIRPDGYIGFRSRPADQTALVTYLDRIQLKARNGVASGL